MSDITLPSRQVTIYSVGDWLAQRWFVVFLVVYGLWVWLPWLAPIFMRVGWVGGGRVLYFIYAFFCHQLPERSFFLFGQKSMYSLKEVQAAWQNTVNPFVLRQFIGNETMGWKVAWSDRMVSFYTSIWIFATAWFPVRRKVRQLAWWAFALLLIPIVLDGGTHAFSDFAGIGHGFRDSNQWLTDFTNNIFPASFYAGDAFGSFNSWMRLITGVLAGLAIVWLAFPFVHQGQGLDKQLDGINYGKAIEQIKNKNPHTTG